MNISKLEKFTPQKPNASDPYHSDLLDEMGAYVTEQIAKDEDQGPSKERAHLGCTVIQWQMILQKVVSGKQSTHLPSFQFECFKIMC
jgi:hypothetical protein